MCVRLAQQACVEGQGYFLIYVCDSVLFFFFLVGVVTRSSARA